MCRWRASSGGLSISATESVRAKAVRGSAATIPGWIIKERLAECDKLPLLPCAITVKLPVAAVEEAPKITGVPAAPAAMLKGLAGFEVTPAGTPERLTCTVPINPFSGFTETVTAELVAP